MHTRLSYHRVTKLPKQPPTSTLFSPKPTLWVDDIIDLVMRPLVYLLLFANCQNNLGSSTLLLNETYLMNLIKQLLETEID